MHRDINSVGWSECLKDCDQYDGLPAGSVTPCAVCVGLHYFDYLWICCTTSCATCCNILADCSLQLVVRLWVVWSYKVASRRRRSHWCNRLLRLSRRERERSLLAILNIHNYITNKVKNVTCGRLPEKASRPTSWPPRKKNETAKKI